MLSNRLAFAALAIACIGAAAGGGYLATRQNAVPTPASAQAQTAPATAPAATTPAPAVAASTVTAKPVQETPVAAGDTSRTSSAPKTTAVKPAEPTRAALARENRPAPRTARQEAAATPINSWPAGAPAQPPATPAPPVVDTTPAAPRPDEHTAQEPARPIDPPKSTFEELVVSADSVIGLQTETRVSSETARVEDRIEGRVTRDVRVGDRVAIPAGTRVIGSVMQVDRGGKLKERAHLGIRFHTLVLADGTRLSIATETISRDGEAPRTSSSQKIGGATVGGAILGAILGGGKGMAIGAAAGAGAGGAAVAASDRQAATLPAGTSMTVRILQPVTVTVDNKD